jgi:tRNA(adenine34) deaminase
MCAGLILVTRIPRVVYGAWDKRFGAFGSVANLLEMRHLNHYPKVQGGVLADESSAMLKEFFRKRRASSL